MGDFWFEFVEITQTIGDGLLFGATCALIGIGFTLIFGAMGKLDMTYAAASPACHLLRKHRGAAGHQPRHGGRRELDFNRPSRDRLVKKIHFAATDGNGGHER